MSWLFSDAFGTGSVMAVPVLADPSQPLGALVGLLRDEPALTQVLGRSSAVLAVPEPARAVVIVAVARLSSRQPLVVALPTSADAERLAHDLGAFLGPDEVDLFPAWETLPFERVSPSVEVMGRRLRTMWHLRNAGRTAQGERGRGAPRVVVASVRALVQRLGPHVEDTEPIIVGHGDVLDPAVLVADLVAGGYRREELVEHRGEVAVRGSIVDVFPSTVDAPVRIDLWGEEVDRLTEFSVNDQRSTIDLSEVELFPCRELLATDEVRERAEALVGAEPWGREQWERLSQGLTFDGMESWLPWLTEGEHTLFDLLEPDAQVLLVDPRRMRDRAGDILAEEADLASTLAVTWDAGSGGGRFPSLHLPFDRAAGPHPGAGLDGHHRAGRSRRGHGGCGRLAPGGRGRERSRRSAPRAAGRRLPGRGGRRRGRHRGADRHPAG